MLSYLFRALNSHDVILEAMLLKTAMVLPGLDASLAENDKDEVGHVHMQHMQLSLALSCQALTPESQYDRRARPNPRLRRLRVRWRGSQLRPCCARSLRRCRVSTSSLVVWVRGPRFLDPIRPAEVHMSTPLSCTV